MAAVGLTVSKREARMGRCGCALEPSRKPKFPNESNVYACRKAEEYEKKGGHRSAFAGKQLATAPLKEGKTVDVYFTKKHDWISDVSDAVQARCLCRRASRTVVSFACQKHTRAPARPPTLRTLAAARALPLPLLLLFIRRKTLTSTAFATRTPTRRRRRVSTPQIFPSVMSSPTPFARSSGVSSSR